MLVAFFDPFVFMHHLGEDLCLIARATCHIAPLPLIMWFLMLGQQHPPQSKPAILYVKGIVLVTTLPKA